MFRKLQILIVHFFINAGVDFYRLTGPHLIKLNSLPVTEIDKILIID